MGAPWFRAPPFSAETGEILRLLRLALGNARPEDAARSEEVDWDVFAAAVKRHRVAPFLAHALPSSERDRLPPAVRHDLLLAGARAMRSARERASLLVDLMGHVESGGVRAWSVKGPLLARELSGTVGARSAGDLDLLVQEREVDVADTLLRSAGCVRCYPARDLSPKQARAYARQRHEFSYVHGDTGIKVELMWRLADRDLTTELLARTHRVDVWCSREVARLSAEAESLYLLLHGSRHRWFRLFWLVDVAQLLARGGIDWEAVRRIAERHRLLPEAAHGALLAAELLGAPLADRLAVPVPDPRLRRFVDRAARRVAGPEWLEAPGAYGAMVELASQLRWARSWADRRAIVGRFLLPGKVLDAVDLPDALFPLYYLVRPTRLVSRSLRRVHRPNTT
jgi:hypothetical protein